jgi:hypothetical protein
MDLQEVGGGRGDWMEMAEDRDGWRALVISIKMRVISWLAAKPGQLLKKDFAPWNK